MLHKYAPDLVLSYSTNVHRCTNKPVVKKYIKKLFFFEVQYVMTIEDANIMSKKYSYKVTGMVFRCRKDPNNLTILGIKITIFIPKCLLRGKH